MWRMTADDALARDRREFEQAFDLKAKTQVSPVQEEKKKQTGFPRRPIVL
jgi:hypothetical protein